MRDFIVTCLLVVTAFLLIIVVPIVMVMNYDYRWKEACHAQGGTHLRPASSSGSRICVQGPIELIPIVVKPF